MNFEFKCPQCGKMIECDETLKGRVVECPHCEKGVVVPRGKPQAQTGSELQRQETSSPIPSALRERPRRPTPPLPRASTGGTPQPGGDRPPPPARPQAPVIPLPPPHRTMPDVPASGSRRAVTVAGMVGLAVATSFSAAILASKMAAKNVPAQPTPVQSTVDFDPVLAAGSEREGRLQNGLDGLKGKLEAIQTEIRGVQGTIKGVQTALKRDIDGMAARIAHVEAVRRPDDAAGQDKVYAEKCDALLRRVEEMLNRIDSAVAMSAARPAAPVGQRPATPPEAVTQGQPPASAVAAQDVPPPPKAEPPKATLADLRSQFKRNVAELNRLRDENPACFLNPKASSIINTSKKIPTKADQRYFTCNRVTYVRDTFYCTACKKDSTIEATSACCDVSSIQSWRVWRTARKNIEVTEKCYARINELYKENASLKQQMRTAQE